MRLVVGQLWPWIENMSEYSGRHSRLGDNREALPSHCDTLRIDVSRVAENTSAFLVHTVGLLLCQAVDDICNRVG